MEAAQESRTSEYESEHECISPRMQISYSEASDRVYNKLSNLWACLITDSSSEVKMMGVCMAAQSGTNKFLTLHYMYAKTLQGALPESHIS